ncbi:MAG: CBS and ACT domain-containing protein [Acidobacteriota bacterium]
MLVRDIMTQTVITVTVETTIEDACKIMHEKNIRHLPVLAGSRVVGVVTDRDILGSTSAVCMEPLRPKGQVADVMAQPPKTAHPLDSVEETARTMRTLKIGCLPVMDGDRLVGIVTGIDLLDALLKLTGVDKPSGRLELRLTDRPGELARLTTFLSERQLNILSILTYPEGSENIRTVLRVNTIESRPLANALRNVGFEVIWPPAKSERG